MKITREFWKTLALIFLVLLSLALTWNIWFFHIDFQNYNSPSDSIKNEATIDNGMTKNLNEVVRPYLVLLKKNGLTLGQTDRQTVEKVYSLFQQGKFAEYTPVNQGHLPKVALANNEYEIVFPAPISMSVFTKLFMVNNLDQFNNKSGAMIDRIEIYKRADETDNKPIAVFYNQTNTPLFYTSVTGIDMRSLKNTMGAGGLTTYNLYHFHDIAEYLPDVPPENEMIDCFNSPINYQNFVPIFFNNIATAVRNKNTYSDGTHQLEKNGNIIQYVNPNIPSLSQASQDPILHAYDFINSHKGWTNNFMLDSLSQSVKNAQADVSFRLTLNGYPIYSTVPYPFQYLSNIDISWENGQLSKLSRTLDNLNVIDVKKLPKQPLPLVSNMLTNLKENLNIKRSDIQSIRLGYGITNNNNSNNPEMKLYLDWFYEYGDKWYSYSESLQKENTTKKGGSGT